MKKLAFICASVAIATGVAFSPARAGRMTINAPTALMHSYSVATLSSPPGPNEYVWGLCYQDGKMIIGRLSAGTVTNPDGTASATLLIEPTAPYGQFRGDCEAVVGQWRKGQIVPNASAPFLAVLGFITVPDAEVEGTSVAHVDNQALVTGVTTLVRVTCGTALSYATVADDGTAVLGPFETPGVCSAEAGWFQDPTWRPTTNTVTFTVIPILS